MRIHSLLEPAVDGVSQDYILDWSAQVHDSKVHALRFRHLGHQAQVEVHQGLVLAISEGVRVPAFRVSRLDEIVKKGCGFSPTKPDLRPRESSEIDGGFYYL